MLVSWSGDTTDSSDGRNVIQINGLFANKCGFSHRQNVLVSYVPTPETEAIQSATKCHLKPITENDWEILSLNSDFIESNLLNQIRVVSPRLVFPVWITNQSNVCLFVQAFNLIPNSKAIILSNSTEVLVCRPEESIEDQPLKEDCLQNDRKHESEHERHERRDSSNWSLTSMFGSIYRTLRPINELNDNLDISKVDKIDYHSNVVYDKVLRVLPFFDESLINNKDLVNTVFISDKLFKQFIIKSFISKLSHILSPNERKREDQKKEKEEENKSHSEEELSAAKQIARLDFKEAYVTVCGHKKCPESSVFICDSLRRQMGISITSRIHLKNLDQSSIPLVFELILCPINVSPNKDKVTNESIKSELARIMKTTLTNRMVLYNGSLIHLCQTDFFTFNKMETTIYAINSDKLSSLFIEISEPFISIQKPFLESPLPLRNVKNIDQKLTSSLCPQYKEKPFAGFDSLFKKCLAFLEFNLKLNPLAIDLQKQWFCKSSGLLVFGQKGSGKTHLLNALMKKISDSPNYVYVHYIDCRAFKGRRIESIQKSWNNSLAEALHRQPSLLVFDDLDAIASLPSKPGQEMSSEAVYSERVALLFAETVAKCNRNDLSFGDGIAIIATSRTITELQPSLLQNRGRHVFHERIELSSPDLTQRSEILRELISHRFNVDKTDSQTDSHIEADLKEISNKCKGYSPLDLTALVDRALHNCYLKTKTNDPKNLVLTEDNFKAAFNGFCPLNLRGLDLELKSTRRLSEVGGLAAVKKCLMETILWSLKYPVLFSKLPLKAQSSILLFGPPGTGKTLLIEAIANECGINFIGIKGPELLSKYVGQSEQSVRDVFNRAQLAKPCILFFDEFDSLAPRRGHDSTGVTDRVVNQMLTQMDGFEEMGTGVYVLAATSRPDLIDPALLRPGRFDKCLHCPLPDQSERLEILNALSAKLSLDSDVDLELIARQTNHFSGADLQALLYSAQLDALHQCLGDSRLITRQTKSNPTDSGGLESRDEVRSDRKSELNLICGPESANESNVNTGNAGEVRPTVGPTYGRTINNGNALNVSPSEDMAKGSVSLAINHKHLLTALDSTKPSINETERIKYNRM